ncbi:MAG: hypothetical protein C0599_05640 [Salinivirgaceae bacterium]|nr:MAG: hypothetical protein C0599_05640 [Salinivirgaceae bacterium]
MKKVFSLLVAGMLAFSFTGCDEEDILSGTPSEEDMQPVADNMNAEKGLMSAASYMNPYGLDEELSTKGAMVDGPTYDYDPVNKILSIDFTGVAGMGGEIIVTYDSDPLAIPLTSIGAMATMIDFVKDGSTYNGTVVFSMTVGTTITMSVMTSDGEVISINNGVASYTWSGNRSIAWIEGALTPVDDTDDVYQLTGSSAGVSSTGTNYESTILTAIILSNDCDYIMYGSQEVVNNVNSDNEATITMTFNVDANGNLLGNPTCNSYFEMHYVSGIFDLTMVMDMDEM